MATFKLRDLESYTITEGPEQSNASGNPASLRNIKSMRRTAALGKSMSLSKNNPNEASHFDTAADANNVTLKSIVIELEDLIETTGEVQVEGVRSNEALLKLRLDKSTAATVDYGDKYRWPSSSRFSREKYIEQLKLRTTSSVADRSVRVAKKLKRSCTAAAHHDLFEDVGEKVDEEQSDAPAAAQQEADGAGEAVEGSFEEAWEESLRRVDAACEATRATVTAPAQVQQVMAQVGPVLDALFPPAGQTMGRSLFSMQEIINTDVLAHIRASMEASQVSMQAAIAKADAADAELTKANSAPLDSDAAIRNASNALTASVDAHEAALRAVKDRLNQVLMDRSDDGNLRSAYDHAQSSLSEWLNEQHVSKTELMTNAAADVKAMNSVHADRQRESDKTRETYEATQAQALSNVQQLESMQEALWREVEERVARIASISAERKTIVTEYLGRSEVEWKRRRYHDEYCKVHEAHRKSLELAGTLAMHSLDVLDRLKTATADLQKRMDEKDLDAGLDEFKSRELQSFAKLYPRYGLAANRLMANTDARNVLASRTARIAESSRDLAIASKDPDAQLLTARAKAAATEAAELEARATKLATNIDYWHDVAVGVEPKCAAFAITLDVSHTAEDAVWHGIVDHSKQAIAADHAVETDGVALQTSEYEKRQADVEELERQVATKASSPPKSRPKGRPTRPKSTTPSADAQGRDEGAAV